MSGRHRLTIPSSDGRCAGIVLVAANLAGLGIVAYGSDVSAAVPITAPDTPPSDQTDPSHAATHACRCGIRHTPP